MAGSIPARASKILSPLPQQHVFGRYAIALASAVLSILLRGLLEPLLGHAGFYLAVYPAVIFSALVCGLGPSILTAVVGTTGIVYWFVDPRNTFSISDQRDIHGLIACVLASAALIALGEANRRKQLRLNEVREELERRVEERTFELSQEAAKVRAQAEWLDAANEAIFVGGCDERITYWNKGAERLYGWSKAEAIGRISHELLHTEFPTSFEEIAGCRPEGDWQGELAHTKRDGTKVTVASRWTALKDAHNNFKGWLEINTDITRRKVAEEAARRMSAHLLKMQDDERRRIARELHDSAGQILAALAMNLDQIRASAKLNPKEAQLLSDSDALVRDATQELRTISHLLHPPLLDEVGLPSALQWYVDGFAKRSTINTTLELAPDFGRLPPDFEIAIFRIIQESLTNVHRHSGSPSAEVRLMRVDGEVRVEIQDRGKGIPMEKQSLATAGPFGVGLRGMRERVQQLGGTLDVRSNDSGTIVRAILPAEPKAAITIAAANQLIA
jgi:PAS domain S-box-containing protein